MFDRIRESIEKSRAEREERERLERERLERELQAEKERLMSLTEKELMVELLMEIRRVNNACDVISKKCDNIEMACGNISMNTSPYGH